MTDAIPSLSEIDSVAFADGCLARNLQTGALCRLNASAGAILELLRAGRPEIEAAAELAALYDIPVRQAEADIAAILQAWRASGLIAAAESAPGERDERGGQTAPALAPPGSATHYSLDIRVGFGGRIVRARCQERELAELLAGVMAPARIAPADIAGNEPVDAYQTLDLIGTEGDFQCWCGDGLMWRVGPRPWARRLLLQTVIGQSLPDGRIGAILHASAVLIDGQAVVLAGLSGSGKSTLTAGLVAAGGRLIADDLLPLTVSDGGSGADAGPGADIGGLWPVPFAISVKQGSWPALGPLFPEFERLKVLTSRGMKVRYLAPEMVQPGHVHRPALVLFPHWDGGGDRSCQPLAPQAVADSLIETGTDLHRTEGALAAFAAFASHVPGFDIRYPSLDGGLEMTRNLLQGNTPLE